MELSAPTAAVFWISVVIAILALLGFFSVLTFLTPYSFWLAIIAFVLLGLGNLVKGM